MGAQSAAIVRPTAACPGGPEDPVVTNRRAWREEAP